MKAALTGFCGQSEPCSLRSQKRSVVLLLTFAFALAACSSGAEKAAAAENPATTEKPTASSGLEAGVTAAGATRAGGTQTGSANARSTEGMTRIPAGPFTYGATESEFKAYVSGSMVRFPGMEEKLRTGFVIPPRQIDLPAFFIDQFEVTNQQYAEFVRASGYQPKHPTNYLKMWNSPTSYPSWAATFPVVWISQEDAQAYCHWRGGRLPTEEEWEKAARGTDARPFPWGKRVPTVHSNIGTRKAEPVGNRAGDKSFYEVYDLGGNVSELTSSSADRAGTKLVVARGGNFVGGLRESLTFRRLLLQPSAARSENVGCRCVLESH